MIVLQSFLNDSPLSVCADIQIKEEPESDDWPNSTLNTNDLSHLHVRLVEEDKEGTGLEGKRLRRVACTCPNCKEAGGR